MRVFLMPAVSFLLTLLVFAYTLTDTAGVMTTAFTRFSYWILWALALAWAYALLKYLRKTGFSPKEFLRRNWPGLLLTFALTTSIFLSVKPGWRVLSDETNLLGVSRSMLYEHKPMNPTMAYYRHDQLQIKHSKLNKRPLLFPFVTHLAHLLAGYRWINPIIVNFLTAWAFLFLFFRIFQPWAGTTGGLGASLLLASHPIFALNATGGGFDLFSAFFMALALQNAWLYLRNPEHEELTLLVMTLLMLANIRYESPIYLPAILLALLAMGRLPDKKGLLRLLMLCSPLVLPIFWQRLLPSNNYEQPAGTPLFSLHAFTENIRELLRSQFVFSYEMPYNNLLIIAAAAFSLTLLAPAVRKKLFTGIRPQFAVLCGTVVGISMLINCAQFFIPIYTHPTGARLFLAFCAACTLITTAYLAQAFKIGGRVLLGAGVAMFMLYSPLAAARHLSNKLLLVRTTNTGYDFLSKYPDKHLVVIVNRPGQYVAMNRGAVSFAYANKNPQELLDNLRDNFISDLVVFQDMDYATTLPKARQTLSAEFTLEPVQDIQTGPDTYLRISKVAIPPPGGA